MRILQPLLRHCLFVLVGAILGLLLSVVPIAILDLVAPGFSWSLSSPTSGIAPYLFILWLAFIFICGGLGARYANHTEGQ